MPIKEENEHKKKKYVNKNYKLQQLYEWLLFIIYFMEVPYSKLDSKAKFKS